MAPITRDAAQSSSSTASPPPPPPPAGATQQGDNIAHALAGAGGGLLSMTLTYPLITLSTRAQVERTRAHSSTVKAVRQILQREGVAGLYAGLESALFGISVTNFVYYYWYEWTRDFFERAAVQSGRASKKLTTIESMLAGALAGSATVLITNPIWVVNTRMTARSSSASDSTSTDETATTSPKKPLSTLGTLQKLLREEGPRALSAGVGPALVLVINPILQYTIFEQLRQLLERRRGGQTAGARDVFLLGALGKLLATALTYPYITVKSRAHVRAAGGSKAGSSNSAADDGMWQSLRRILREDGWAGLYGGLGPKLTQSVLTAAFLFTFKDVLYSMSVQARQRLAAKTP